MDPKPPKPDGMGLINAASLLAKLADSADEEKESNSAQQSQSQSELYEKTQDGSLKCPKCTRTFPKLVALKSHIIMHSDIRKHGCEVCGKKFARRHDLLRHLRTVHASSRTEDSWQTQYYSKKPKLEPLETYPSDHSLQEMTPTSAGLYEEYLRKSSLLSEPLLGHRSSLTDKVLSHRISAPEPSTFIPETCIHNLGIGYCRICPQVDIGKVAFDKSFKCVHDKLAHFCRSCRNEGYWRKLEEEKRRRSLGGGLKGFSGSGSDYRGVQAGQRVQGPEQRNGYLPDQRNAYIPDQRNAYLPDQRNAYLPDQRSIPDHQSIPNHRNLDQRGMGMIDQRVMIDQRFPDPRILDQRLLMDQRGFVDNRSLGDPRNFVIDQRMVMNGDSRRVGFDQPSLRMNPNGFGVNGMIDQRGLINPGYEREMMDQKAILEHQGIMGQRIMSEKRGMFEQSGLMNILDTPGLSDQRMMVGNGGYDQAGKSSFERMTPEESIGNTRLDQGSSHFGQKRDANGNVKSLGNIL